MLRQWYFKQNFKNKLSVILIGSILIMVGILAIYFDYFLQSNYATKAQQRIDYSFKRIALNLDSTEQALQRGISFINDNTSFTASIELINTYQDKADYNSALLDEEKKLIAEDLLYNVKLSFNDTIALYDHNQELIAYVYKSPQGYVLNFISFENGKPVLFSRLENQSDFQHQSFTEHSFIPYKHLVLHSKQDNNPQGAIDYFINDNVLIVSVHMSQYDEASGQIVSHIDMSRSIQTGYFKALSEDLNMNIAGSVLSPIQPSSVSLLGKEGVEIIEDHQHYIGVESLKTQNGPYYFVAKLDNEFESEVLQKNRLTFLLFIMAVSFIIIALLRWFFKRDIALPLEHVMKQIHRIEKQDYSPSTVAQTGDEFESISKNINNLANTVQEREHTLIRLLELSPIAMRIAKKQGDEVVYWNTAYVDLIEHSNPIGISPQIYYANPNEYEKIIGLLAEGKTIKNQFVELSVNTSIKWVLASYMPFIFQGEEVILGWFYDITERKHLEQELAEREEHYRIIVNQVADAIAVIDIETLCFNDVNEAACRMLGYSREEMIGQPLSLIQGNQDEKVMHHIIDEIEAAGEMQFENRHRRKDGSLIDVSITSRVIFKHGKKFLVPAWHDITEQKQYNEFLEVMLNATHEGILIFDDNHLCIRANHTIETMLGYANEELIGKSLLYHVASDYKNLMIQNMHKDEILPCEVKMIHKDGAVIDILLREKNLLLGGDKLRFVAVMDISAFNQAIRTSEASNRAKSEFLANMSHEIRTPLNGILGLTDLTLKTNLTDQQKNYLNKAKQSSIALLNIINDILDYSKIEAKKLGLEEIEFNVYELFEHVSDLFGYQASENDISLHLSIDPRVPSILIGDPLRISQILNNLVGNAIKFTDAGEVNVRLEYLWSDEKNIRLKFSVQDTGIGITAEQKEQLFHPFVQADTSNTRKYGGSGLGLMISQQLVQLMGGSLTLESEYHKGSTFSFVLEVKYTKTKGDSAGDVVQEESKTLGFNTKYRLLLVEDNKINQLVAQEYLESFGLNVETAYNGQEAVDMAKKKGYDLILMDLQMPVMDGFEATRRIREFNAEIPIIALSAAVMLEDKELTQAAGMNGHIGKPIDAEELEQILHTYLDINTEKITTVADDITPRSPIEHLYGVDMNDLSKKIRKADKRNQFLHVFAESHRDFAKDLKNAPPGSPLFKQMIHSLKGVSGNASLTNVYELTKEIESSDDLQSQSTLVSRLLEELEQVIAAIDGLVQKKRSAQAANHTKESFLNTVDLLLSAIHHNEFIDDEQIDLLADQIQYFFDHESAIKIKNNLSLFNYDSARILLESMREKLYE